MAKQDYTPHQQNIISQYYDRLDTIMLTKLQETVTDLYLAETEAKRDRLWKRVHQAMNKLGTPATLAEHIMAKKDVEILAANVQDWLKHSGPKG
jgi:alcohol dehydrogenase class IV